jgi:phosphoenolpyruvate carboxylase
MLRGAEFLPALGRFATCTARNERLRQAVLTLWQTSMLRRNRLTVLDEVANGLSYYDYTFLREVPRLFSALQDDLEAADPADRAVETSTRLPERPTQ